MPKYQTVKQIMLDYLYNEVAEDLRLSRGAMSALLKDGDDESWYIESENYKLLQGEMANLHWLRKSESNSYTGNSVRIKIEYSNSYDELLFSKELS